MANNFSDYIQLLEKISSKFQEIYTRQSKSMQCSNGCHQCCQPNLTIFGVERDYIAQYLADRPDLQAQLRQLEKADPHGGNRCRMLDENGACSIYDARPVVCRSHGLPLRMSENPNVIGCCPLNFEQVDDLKKLSEDDIVDLETLNTILSTVNRKYAGTEDAQRHALTLEGILGKN